MASTASPKSVIERKHPPWQPPALRPINLVAAVLLCWTLILILQVLLSRSERDGGILFAANINDLSPGTKFLYLYLPTILAVTFSIYWSWIDGDAKRCQPYYEFSKKDGATGKNSLLLCYPTMFVLWIPFVALKRRHWMVFWSSTGTLLMILGLVPTQAGIFTTKVVSRTTQQDFGTSIGFETTTELQSASQYIFSLFAIVAHNETLPPYMTRDYAIRPFAPATADDNFSTTWSARTTLYSLETQCEKATSALFLEYNTTDCVWNQDLSNDTSLHAMTGPSEWSAVLDTAQKFAHHCLDQHVFFASFIRNSTVGSDQSIQSTSLYCNMNYYEQVAQVTVDSGSKQVINISDFGPKIGLPASLARFVNSFEEELTGDGRVSFHEGDMPTTVFPSLSSSVNGGPISADFMNEMAVILDGRPLIDHLDPVIYEKSLLRACRLHFVRAMAALLDENDSHSASIQGDLTKKSEAVVLDPFFTYSAEAFLALTSTAALALLTISYQRKWNIMYSKLSADPGSIAALMSLVADDTRLLNRLGTLSRANADQIDKDLQNEILSLENPSTNLSTCRLTLLSPEIELDDTTPVLNHSSTERESLIATKYFRPLEFHVGSAILIVGAFSGIWFSLGAFFRASTPTGLSLPFKSRLGQEMVTSYLPTAIAMLIEPLWVLYTRSLCLYLPFQELLTLNAHRERSIEVNYGSVPPQLTFIKALRARHFLLASVCAMALLSNILATAFAGLFFRNAQTLEIETNFNPWTNAKFRNISSTYSESSDHFVVVESQYMRGTSLPPWTDGKYMFLPFYPVPDQYKAPSALHRVRTKAISSDINCQALEIESDYDLTLIQNKRPGYNSLGLRFQVALEKDQKQSIQCFGMDDVYGPWSEHEDGLDTCGITHWGLETSSQLRNKPEDEYFLPEDLTICESSMLLGWVRLPERRADVCQPDELYHALSGNQTALEDGGYREDKITPERDLAKNLAVTICRPTLIVQEATIVVNSDGYVEVGLVEVYGDTASQESDQETYLSFLANNIMPTYIREYNQYPGNAEWHNDTTAHELLNYFMKLETNSTRLLDPSQSLPQFSDFIAPLGTVHAKLFSTWLSLHRDIIFDVENITTIMGQTLYEEERLFFNKAPLIISEIILGAYIIVTIVMFVRRPTEFLPRLPNSIAAIVPYFAGSKAVQDFKGTGGMTTKERIAYVEKKGPFVYGYGSYTGSGGQKHIGIEKIPFVTAIERKEEKEGRAWWTDWWKGKYQKVRQVHEE